MSWDLTSSKNIWGRKYCKGDIKMFLKESNFCICIERVQLILQMMDDSYSMIMES